MKKTIAVGTIVGGAAIVSLIIILSLMAEPAQISTLASPKAWYSTVHVTVNSYHSWRLDPLTALLSSIPASMGLSGFPIHVAAPTFQLVIFFVGLVMLMLSQFRSQSVNPSCTWTYPAIVTLSLLILFGRDEVVFGTLEWIPWLILALRGTFDITSIREGIRRLPIVIAAIFFASLLAQAANQFSLFAALFSLFVASQETVRSKGRTLSALIALAMSTYVSFSIPLASFPNYPYDALTVPDDGVPGIVRPDIGKDYSIAVINREAVRSISLSIAIPLSLASIAIAIFRRRYQRVLTDRFYLIPLALTLSLILDSLLPEKFTLSLPVESLQRVLPGLTYTPFNLIALAGSMVVSYLGLVALRTSFAPYLLFAAIVFSKLSIAGVSWAALLAPPYSSNTSQDIATLAYRMSPDARRKIVSPSLFVLQHFNYLFLAGGEPQQWKETKDWITLSAIKGKELISKIETLPPSATKQVRAMIDGDITTRWTPGGGTQRGGESIRLSFSLPVTFDGLRINTGSFSTDFPRGLTVAIPKECSADSGANRAWIFPDWRGSLRFTPDNDPYFSPQGDVTVPFGVSVTASCITIEQTSSDENYDWSVAEINLLVR